MILKRRGDPMSAKVLRALLRLCLLLCIVPAVAEAVEVSATAAVLLDADTGQVLYEKTATSGC